MCLRLEQVSMWKILVKGQGRSYRQARAVERIRAQQDESAPSFPAGLVPTSGSHPITALTARQLL